MFANLDRQEFIELLNKLGSDDDQEALTAARDLHAKVVVANVSWEDLLLPEEMGDEEDDEAEFDDAELDAGDEGDEDQTEAGAEGPAASDADDAPLDEAGRTEALSLIEAIGRLDVSKATRAELEEYKEDIAEGEFGEMDLRYLRALHNRLAK